MKDGVRCGIHVSLAGILAILLSLVPRVASAHHECAERKDVVLYLALDVSSSMSGSRQVAASAFGVELVDALNATGDLNRAGDFTFCGWSQGGMGWWVTEVRISTNISPVRNDLVAFGSVDLNNTICNLGTTLFDAIGEGVKAINNEVTSSRIGLFVVLSDGDDTASMVHTAASAASSLASRTAVQTELIFIGSDSGAATLRGIADLAGSHVNARSSSPSALAGLVDDVVARTCTNFRPHADFNMNPSGGLDLGTDGFSVSFDGSPSSDVENSHSSLSFSWRLTGPGGTINMSGKNTSHTFSDSDIGTWSVRLTVTDTRGSSDTRIRSLEVRGSEPNISLSGPTEIDALQEVKILAEPTTDVDGGDLSFVWEVVSTPTSADIQPPGPVWTDSEISFVTNERDITLVAGRTIGEWRFRCVAEDNERDTDAEEYVVHVRNLPPSINLLGVENLVVGEPIEVETTELEDPDGGDLSFEWDLIQVPISSGLFTQEAFQTSPDFYQPTGLQPSDDTGYSAAGTWVLRLRVADNEGEEVEEEFTVLVDAPPEASLTGPEHAAIETDFTLDASASRDPDSPDDPECPSDPDHCHETLDGRTATVSPGIVDFRWSLVDVPSEHLGTYVPGPVFDVLGVPGGGPTLSIPAGTLDVGEWVFQVEVIDGEGGSDWMQHTVNMVHLEGPPIAIVSSPAYYVTQPDGTSAIPVGAAGTWSFDPDNLLVGQPFGPGLGIADWAWAVANGPSTCPVPTFGNSPLALMFAAGTLIPPGCFGWWQLALQVTDDDPTPRQAFATQWLVLSDCPALICIDAPTTSQPEVVEFSDKTDVFIAYHLDSGLYDRPECSQGCYAELEIFHESNPTVPVFHAYEPNPLGTDLGGQHFFNWNGFITGPSGDPIRPLPGRYSTKVSVADVAFGGTTYSDAETDNILIEVADISVSSADEYLSLNAAEGGNDDITLTYQLSGGATVTELFIEVYRQGEGTPLFEVSAPPASSGVAHWDGRSNTGELVAPDYYELALRAVGSTGTLDRSEKQPVAAYWIDLSLDDLDAADEDDPGAFLEVGDDLAIGTVELLPDGLLGTLTIEEEGSAVLDGVNPFGDWSSGVAVPVASASSPGLGLKFKVEGLASSHVTLKAKYLPPTAPTSKEAEDSVRITPVRLDLTARCSDDAREAAEGIFVQRRLGSGPVDFASEKIMMRQLRLQSSHTFDGVRVEVVSGAALVAVLASSAPGVDPAVVTPPFDVESSLFAADGTLDADLFVRGIGFGEAVVRVVLSDGGVERARDEVKLRIGDVPAMVGEPFAGFPHWRTQDVGNSGSPVQIALDPTVHDGRRGLPAQVYLVEHRTLAEWADDNTLVDVTGGPELLAVTPAPGTIADAANQLSIWSASLPGEFDVVVDYGGCGNPPVYGSLDPDDLIKPLDGPPDVAILGSPTSGGSSYTVFEYGNDFEDGDEGDDCTPLEDELGAACTPGPHACPYKYVCVDGGAGPPGDGDHHCTKVTNSGCGLGLVCVNTDGDETAHCRPQAQARIHIPLGYGGFGQELQDCEDGEDNDGDGKTDCEDPDCAAYSPACGLVPENCNDGADNNSDGVVDCDDPYCLNDPGCWPGFRLRGRVVLPEPVGSSHPLVVLAHGRHWPRETRAFDPNDSVGTAACQGKGCRWRLEKPSRTSDQNYRGFTYLQEVLASQGFASLSIDLDELFGGPVPVDWSSSPPRLQTSRFFGWPVVGDGVVLRAWVLLKNIEHVLSLPTFAGHIDTAKIHLVGHSRGGDAVLAAWQILSDPPALGPASAGATGSDSQVVGVAQDSIASVVSIAPTTFSNVRVAAPFLLIYGTADGDVSGASPTASPYRHYDRATDWRVALTVRGANHNWFNATWKEDDAYAGTPGAIGLDLLQPGDQRSALAAYLASWVLGLEGEAVQGSGTNGKAFRKYFLNSPSRLRPLSVPATIVPAGSQQASPFHLYIERRTSSSVVADDYETNPPGATSPEAQSSSGGTVTETGLLWLREELLFDSDVSSEYQPANRVFRDTKGALVRWSDAAQLTLTFPAPADLRLFSAFSLAISQQPRQPAPNPTSGLTFSVVVVDSAGNTSEIRTDIDGEVGPPYVSSDAFVDTTSAYAQTLSIALDRFAVDGKVNLAEVVAIHLRFDAANNQAWTSLDNWEFIR